MNETAWLVACACTLSIACVQSVEVVLEDVAVETQATRLEVAYHQEIEREHLQQESDPGGPIVAVYLSTGSDLAQLAEKQGAHHLYYRVFACNLEDADKDLYSGRVYNADESDLARVYGSQKSDLNYYKVYVPIHLGEAVDRLDNGVNLNAEIFDQAQQHGLCLRVAGFSMAFTGLSSDPVKLPVQIVERVIAVE